MQTRGIVVELSEIQSGTSKAGKDWKKRDVVIQTEHGEFNRFLAVTFFNDRVSNLDNIEVGATVDIDFSVDSRKHQDRYFHNVNGYGINPVVQQLQAPKNENTYEPVPPDENSLPF